MSKAKERTDKLIRKNIPMKLLVKNSGNPNKMSDAEFNLLCDNIERMGVVDAIMVRPIQDGRYRIVGGHHRYDALDYLGFEEAPCTIVTDEAFDEDAENFQLVRMNVIHGKLDPNAFFDMYNKLSKKYSDEILQDSFGFADEAEFRRLIKKTAKQLPPDLRSDFMKAAKEIKTIDDLAKVLNSLLTKNIDQLDYGYMVLDFGGKDSIWLRLLPKMKVDFLSVAELCKTRGKTVDHFMHRLLQLIATDGLADFDLDKFMDSLPDVVIAEEVEIPTLDVLSEL